MSDYVIDFRSVVRLVLKLSGLALMIYGLVTIVSFVPFFFTRGDLNIAMDALGVMTAPLITALFGLFLWLFPAPVSNTLTRFESPAILDPSAGHSFNDAERPYRLQPL